MKKRSLLLLTALLFSLVSLFYFEPSKAQNGARNASSSQRPQTPTPQPPAPQSPQTSADRPAAPQTPAPPQAGGLKQVPELIKNSKSDGMSFDRRQLFRPATGAAVGDAQLGEVLKAGVVFELDRPASESMLLERAEALTLPLPDGRGGSIELELVKVDIFAPGFSVKTSAPTDERIDEALGVHYRGIVKGNDRSLAAISVFKNEVMGFFSTEAEGNWVLGRLDGDNPTDRHVLYAEKDLKVSSNFSCDTEDPETVVPAADLQEPQQTAAAAVRCVRMYVEADHDLYLNKGSSVASTTSYLTGLFNQSATLFGNDGVPVSMSETLVWNTPSPYVGTESEPVLQQFRSTRTTFNGDTAHLVSLNRNYGGRAFVDVLCGGGARHAVSDVDPSFANVPTYSWSVYVFTHEAGHNLGSQHTHACVWNGNGTAIDGCGPAANPPSPFEGSCTGSTVVPSGGGTIMSYCHLVNVGINFTLGFGPQPGALIRNRFNAVTCLTDCGSGGCTFAVDPPSRSFTSAGGSSSFNVTTGSTCAWTATVNAPAAPEGSSLFGKRGLKENLFSLWDDGAPDAVPAATPAAAQQPVFLNSTSIIVADRASTTSSPGLGSPYPSTINVSGMGGTVTLVQVGLNGVTHPFPDDLDVVLVGPGGQRAVLMSDAGDNFDVAGVDLIFDQSAAATLPDTGQIVGGVYRPSNFAGLSSIEPNGVDNFPSPGPGQALYGTDLRVFNGTAPNGTWRLYVVDDEPLDTGRLVTGWALGIITSDGGTSWINITSGSSGTGNGTVSYTVAANSGTAQRTGTITVNGQTHTITQSGTSVTTRTLVVSSSNPSSGVSVSVSPSDNNGAGGGTTQFSRTYNQNTTVTLTAPATAGGNNFQKWLRDGIDWSTSASTSVTMDANHAMTAVYTTPPPQTRTLTVASSNPSNGLGVSVSPNDNSGLGGGSTQFTRTYNLNTSVTLTAPAAAGTNTFQKWQRNGVDWSTNLTTSVVMDANHTMTAVYITPPPQTRTLTVASFNPSSGVSMSLSPSDNSGAGGGATQFTRTYNQNTSVTLTAPATAGGNNFQKWQRDGTDWSTSLTTSVVMDVNHTMTAIYVAPPPPTRTLTVASLNPSNSLGVSVSPNDNSGLGGGTTQFTRTYNLNTSVTLTAPATAGANVFQKWQRNGVDWSTNLTTSVVMDANHTMTAVYVTPPPPTRTLTVASFNPSSGVSVGVSPADNSGAGGGATQFTRTYNLNTSVTLTAPATAGGNNFQKWQRDGSDWSTSLTTSVAMDANHTMTAIYVTPPPPTRTLTVASSNPSNGLGVSVSPNDVNGQGGGSTQFTRTYSLNANVTLTAPATAGTNVFQKWQRDGVDWSTSLTTSVVMDANHTMTAVYITPPPPTRTLTVASFNPSSGVSMSLSPNDNSGAGGGATQFTRTYNLNASVTLTAPATAGANNFQKWQRDGVDWSSNQTTTVVMDANHTMTAIYVAPPPPTRTLTVASLNPSNSLGVSVSPNDINGQGGGTTQFTRTYNLNASVTLTAPATAGTNTFQKWQRDGADWSTALTTSVVMDANHTMTAVYITPPPQTRTLTVASLNPSNGLGVSVSPNDNGGLGGGATQFTRTYNLNTSVTLTAPATAGVNIFQKWQRNGVDWSTSLTTSVVTDASHTMTAVYASPPDTVAPALSVTSHADGQTVTTAAVTLAGAASDAGRGDSGVSSVTVGGVRAAGDTAAGAGTANWSRSITLNEGANVVTVVARDNSPARNATTLTLTINYQPPRRAAFDYDGDGRADLAVWRKPDGNWYISNSSNGSTTARAWGSQSAGDVPVGGDYDGDGRTDLAVWRASTGAWLIQNSSNGASRSVPWGSQSLGDVPVPGDYDGDRRTDVAVWRASTGTWLIQLSSTGASQSHALGNQSLGDVPAPADYDGDRRTDVAVWRASTGAWHGINSTNGAAWSTPWGAQSLGDVPLARDYDGDGRADLAVWRKTTGAWLILNSSNGASRVEPLGDQSLGDVPVPADYDGDGRTDLAVWRAPTGVWHLVHSSTGAPLVLPWGSQSAGDVPLPAPSSSAPAPPLPFNAAYAAQSGDFDGDDKTDVAVWRKSNGTWYVSHSSNNSSTSREWGVLALGDVPVPGDYDGDGNADFAVWRASNGTWFISNSATGTTTSREWGNRALGDVPVPADFDGDDKADLAVWRASTGTWFILNSATGTLREQAWGARSLGDVPVPGDYDGDGNTDLAVWRASAGTWHILNSSTGVGRTVSFGVQALGDVPVPADYDGDGRTDVAVWRASNGTWYVSHSSTGASVTKQWGVLALGDVPVPGDFDGDGRDDFAVWRSSTGTWHASSSATGASTSKQWGSSSLGDTPASTSYVVVGTSGAP